MNLNELMDAPMRWEWKRSGGRWPVAYFLVGEKRYSVMFSKLENMEFLANELEDFDVPVEVVDRFREGGYREVFEVVFGLEGQGDAPSTGMTGTGDEVKVISTVIGVIKEFIRLRRVDVLTFSAKRSESSRVSLYTRLARRFSRKGNYSYTDDDEEVYVVIV